MPAGYTVLMNDLETLIRRELFDHPVITRNAYTEWFARGEADEDQVAELLMQFSVFSNHFLVVQVKRMVNAGTLEGEACARDILLNELGVAIDHRTGAAEGRTFRSANAHLNWLRECAAPLGLSPLELGKWKNGSAATHRFLDGLDRTYGSRDGNMGAGASFAIETWAAFGIGAGPELEARNFWKQLVVGLEAFNERREAAGLKPLPLGFFKFHFETESGHGAGVWKELEQIQDKPDFDARRFLKGGRQALDAIHQFWLGLDESRRRGEDALTGVNVAQWAL
jgi:hypothetical protein